MKKLNMVQKTILILGILISFIGVFGKHQGWENNDWIAFLYTGTSFIWISFLNNDSKCERRWFKKIYKKYRNG